MWASSPGLTLGSAAFGAGIGASHQVSLLGQPPLAYRLVWQSQRSPPAHTSTDGEIVAGAACSSLVKGREVMQIRRK
jgi:hypothetical protein